MKTQYLPIALFLCMLTAALIVPSVSADAQTVPPKTVPQVTVTAPQPDPTEPTVSPTPVTSYMLTMTLLDWHGDPVPNKEVQVDPADTGAIQSIGTAITNEQGVGIVRLEPSLYRIYTDIANCGEKIVPILNGPVNTTLRCAKAPHQVFFGVVNQ